MSAILITVKGLTIYHTGDSDFIPEMKGAETGCGPAAGQRHLRNDR